MGMMTEFRRLEVDHNWMVQIPLELRDGFAHPRRVLVDVCFNLSGGDDDLEMLLEALIHEGVLMNPEIAGSRSRQPVAGKQVEKSHHSAFEDKHEFEMLLESLIHDGVLIDP